MARELNPYSAPAAVQLVPEAQSVAVLEARRIRQANAGAERALRQYMLCLCGAYLLVAGISYMIWNDAASKGLRAQSSTLQDWISLVQGVGAILALAAGLVINVGVRRLAAWARLPLTLLCVAGMVLLFPIGTLAAMPILWTLYARSGLRLLTTEYEGIVRDSDEPAAGRTSLVTWIGALLLLLLVAAVIFIAKLPPEFRRPPQ